MRLMISIFQTELVPEVVAENSEPNKRLLLFIV
jgi:hypothetical protein